MSHYCRRLLPSPSFNDSRSQKCRQTQRNKSKDLRHKREQQMYFYINYNNDIEGYNPTTASRTHTHTYCIYKKNTMVATTITSFALANYGYVIIVVIQRHQQRHQPSSEQQTITIIIFNNNNNNNTTMPSS